MARTASATCRPCAISTSTCRSFATISSAVCLFLAIDLILHPKIILQGGPLQRGQITTRPITTQPRKTIARSIPSKRSSSHTSVSQPVRASSKLTTVLAMLRAPGGTTVADIMKATGWQQHSVRGFLTGVVRKRLKLDLASDKADGERRYRIGKSAGSK
ncbi:DUF3489 domain-containing protein [Afipia broomeae]|uniref:DUF3489 domain-containing protein n=1 Tax=Afipia broomeae TaxID=56946 RepID=UPI00322204A9